MSTTTTAARTIDGDTIAKVLEDTLLRDFVDYEDCESLRSLKTSEELFGAAAQLESFGRLAAIAETGSGAFDDGVIAAVRQIEIMYEKRVVNDREFIERVNTTAATEVAKWASPGESFADVLVASEKELASSELELASVRALLEAASGLVEVPA
jgi:hypothetical protein